MLERFTEKAIKVIVLAENESRGLGHNFVDTEQLLLGLLAEGTSIAARVLASFGLHLNDVRAAVEAKVGHGSDSISRQIPLTPGAERALVLAAQEARGLHHNYIGPEHILLGLLREENGAAVQVLDNFGAKPGALRSDIQQTISDLTLAMDADDPNFESMLEHRRSPHSREIALANLSGLYSFIKAGSVPQELFGWLEDKSSVLGLYLNAQDDYLLICEQGIHWYDGEARTYVEYKSIKSVELPQDENDPYLKLVLMPKDSILMLPVLHSTEDHHDFATMYEYLFFSIAT